MTIKIPVSAELNSNDIKREIEQMRAALNSLGSAAAKLLRRNIDASGGDVRGGVRR